MSVKAMSAAWDAGVDLELAPIQRLILLRLGDAADDFGYSWLGVTDLAVHVGADRRTIQRHLKELASIKALDRVDPGGGRSRPALYRVLPLILDDDVDAPGLKRYERRFRLVVGKGDNLSRIREGKGRQPERERVTPDALKGGAGVTRPQRNPKELEEEDLDLPIRKTGETWGEYLKRVSV